MFHENVSFHIIVSLELSVVFSYVWKKKESITWFEIIFKYKLRIHKPCIYAWITLTKEFMFKELQIINLHHDNAFLYLRALFEYHVFHWKCNIIAYLLKTLNLHRYLNEWKKNNGQLFLRCRETFKEKRKWR